MQGRVTTRIKDEIRRKDIKTGEEERNISRCGNERNNTRRSNNKHSDIGPIEP